MWRQVDEAHFARNRKVGTIEGNVPVLLRPPAQCSSHRPADLLTIPSIYSRAALTMQCLADSGILIFQAHRSTGSPDDRLRGNNFGVRFGWVRK